MRILAMLLWALGMWVVLVTFVLGGWDLVVWFGVWCVWIYEAVVWAIPRDFGPAPDVKMSVGSNSRS